MEDLTVVHTLTDKGKEAILFQDTFFFSMSLHWNLERSHGDVPRNHVLDASFCWTSMSLPTVLTRFRPTPTFAWDISTSRLWSEEELRLRKLRSAVKARIGLGTNQISTKHHMMHEPWSKLSSCHHVKKRGEYVCLLFICFILVTTFKLTPSKYVEKWWEHVRLLFICFSYGNQWLLTSALM